MSDSYFIGAVARIHDLVRTKVKRGMTSEEQAAAAAREAEQERERGNTRPQLGMMVSLDHTIFFHSPRDFRADEWMYCEMESPWAGDGRGVVHQKIFTQDGRLIATCVQEVCLILLRERRIGGVTG
jgi:hypothetical protein